jgi:competence protein ComEC
LEKAKKYVWRQVPLFRFLWPFLLGIGLGIYHGESLFLGFVLLSTVITALLGFLLYKLYRKSLGVLLTFALIGYCVSVAAINTPSGLERETDITQRIWIVKSKGRVEFKNDRLRMMGIIQNGTDDLMEEKVLFYLKVDSNFSRPGFGDMVLVNSRLSSIRSPKNPGMFDFKKYMASKGIEYQGYADVDEWRILRKSSGFKKQLNQVHFAAVEQLNENQDWEKESAILSALLLGNKTFLDKDQKTSFAKAGAMHVLAVSGLHVGIIYLVLLWLTKPLSRRRAFRILKTFLILLSLWAFAGITGFSPSVVRSSTMFSFMAVAGLLDRRSSG